MFTHIAHVVIATKSLEESVKLYEEKFSAKAGPVYVNNERQARETRIQLSNVGYILSEPLSENSPVGTFIAQKGEGIYILGLAVDSMAPAQEDLKKRGAKLIHEKRANGATEVFVDPASARGALIQLVATK
ncbi:MAG: VOC family protein [Chloroflexi bacterium]|nr:VOC family protein [Chloroflexota bacterium]